MREEVFYSRVLDIINMTLSWFKDEFEYDEDGLNYFEDFGSVDEPGDVARENYHDRLDMLSDIMKEFKLESKDYDNDNDCFWFTLRIDKDLI